MQRTPQAIDTLDKRVHRYAGTDIVGTAAT
jgi:hypothetical protein